MQKKINWGIIGAGIIAEKMADAIRSHSESCLYAIGSKNIEKAMAFAQRNNVEKAVSYAELTTDPNIDVVYVATTHNFHYENALMVLESGKPLVMEKPFTVNATQAETLQKLAFRKNLFIMEAIWVRFLPNLKRLKQIVQEGQLGEVRQVMVSYGKIVPPQQIGRLRNPDLAGGATLDLGIYPISVLSYILGEIPSYSKSFCRFSESDVDEIADYTFRYPSGCMAQVSTSFALNMENAARFYGTKGKITFPAFPSGDSFLLQHHDGGNVVLKEQHFEEKHQKNGFIYQVEEAVNRIRAGETESPIIPINETVALMQVMDDLRAEWNFKYTFE